MRDRAAHDRCHDACSACQVQTSPSDREQSRPARRGARRRSRARGGDADAPVDGDGRRRRTSMPAAYAPSRRPPRPRRQHERGEQPSSSRPGPCDARTPSRHAVEPASRDRTDAAVDRPRRCRCRARPDHVQLDEPERRQRHERRRTRAAGARSLQTDRRRRPTTPRIASETGPPQPEDASADARVARRQSSVMYETDVRSYQVSSISISRSSDSISTSTFICDLVGHGDGEAQAVALDRSCRCRRRARRRSRAAAARPPRDGASACR